MIIVKIDENNKCEKHNRGTIQELLENIRVLDIARERILNNIKAQTVEDLKKEMPNIPTKMHQQMVDEVMKETLESITVLSEVKNQNDL